MMSRRNYIILLPLLIISEIVNLPYLFFQIPFFDNFLNENGKPLTIISIGLALITWWLILDYFFRRKWTLSFVAGICLVISNSIIAIMMAFENDVSVWDNKIASGIILLSYPLSIILFGLSFLITNKTKELRLIRIYGVAVLISILSSFIRLIFDSDLTDYFMSFAWLIKSIIFALHIIYERNTPHSPVASNEILDAA